MASVTLTGLSKSFEDNCHAVRDLDLEISDGEFLVLVGPSGCGKTTTLRMIAGLETISAGTVKIGDRVVNEIAPRGRDVAMVFQNSALYPHLTVFENLAFALKLRRTPQQEIGERVAWVASLLGLESLLARKPSALSGGERQRVALGRAIIRKPAVFLLDEPLSNLDSRLRLEIRAEIKRLHRQLGTTTIYVTHDQEEALALGDRVCVMCRGRMRQCAPPLEVYQKPADRFVAGFLGMPPMNFLEGELEEFEGRAWFVSEDFRLSLPNAETNWLNGSGRCPVIAGIRPESMVLAKSGEEGREDSFSGIVELVEPLGSVTHATLMLRSGQRMVCRVTSDEVAVGKSVRAILDARQIHLFAPPAPGDSEGMALRLRGGDCKRS